MRLTENVGLEPFIVGRSLLGRFARTALLAAASCSVIVLTPLLTLATDPVREAAEGDRPDTPLTSSRFGQTLWASGFTLAFAYGGVKITQVTGESRSSQPYGADLHLSLALDTNKAGLFPGGSFYLDLQSQWGQGQRVLVFNHKKVAPQTTDRYYTDRLNEVWFKQQWSDGKLGIKFGKQDATGDFLASDLGGDFPAQYISALPNIPIPTSPKAKAGAVLFYKPAEFLRVLAGIYSGGDLSANGGYDRTFEAID